MFTAGQRRVAAKNGTAWQSAKISLWTIVDLVSCTDLKETYDYIFAYNGWD